MYAWKSVGHLNIPTGCCNDVASNVKGCSVRFAPLATLRLARVNKDSFARMGHRCGLVVVDMEHKLVCFVLLSSLHARRKAAEQFDAIPFANARNSITTVGSRVSCRHANKHLHQTVFVRRVVIWWSVQRSRYIATKSHCDYRKQNVFLGEETSLAI